MSRNKIPLTMTIAPLNREELELIAHVLYTYPYGQGRFAKSYKLLETKINDAIENHKALQTRYDQAAAYAEREMTEYLNQLPVVEGEVIDNE